MCGRYYVDDATAKEIRQLIRDVEAGMKSAQGSGTVQTLGSAQGSDSDSVLPQARGQAPITEIYPSSSALVLRAQGHHLLTDTMQWGFSGRNGLLINARAETALAKKTFSESVQYRRLVVPARGFYEWSRAKEKNRFYAPDSSLLYMAGIYDTTGENPHFAILTTEAIRAVAPIHDRSPLLLDDEGLRQWLLLPGGYRKVLQFPSDYSKIRIDCNASVTASDT